MVISLKIMASSLMLAILPLSTQAEFIIEAGPYFQTLEYEEFDRQNNFLDSDKGDLFGAYTEISWHTDRLSLGLNYHSLSGDLDYDSILTDSSTDIDTYQTTLKAQFLFPLSTQWQLSIHSEFGSNTYQRDIASSGIYFGLDETYEYDFTHIGIGLNTQLNDSNSLHLQVFYIDGHNATLKVKFLSEQFDTIKFDTDNPSGYKLQGEWIKSLSSTWQFKLQAQYKFLESDRSDSAPLFSNNNTSSSSVSEPASEITSTSLLIGLQKKF